MGNEFLIYSRIIYFYYVGTHNNIHTVIKPDTKIELKKSTDYSARVYDNMI